MSLQCGIVGLPNVGKSTLFNALTSSTQAESANYPFCTVDPNVGIVSVPDSRLNQISNIIKPKKTIQTSMKFLDIAGLVSGASKGEGLGNQFLSHIRQTDAIVHLVRCFEDSQITHVEGDIDPLRDVQIISTELLLSDLEIVEKRLIKIQKTASTSKDKKLKEEVSLLEKILETLKKGDPVRSIETETFEVPLLKSFCLLTQKPVLYVCNVDEESLKKGNHFLEKMKEHANKEKSGCIQICCHLEAEIACLKGEERKEFLQSLNLESSGLDRLIKASYDLLKLETFFTAGPQEVKAWTVEKGTKAPQAAGVIHSDFEKGFIRADAYSFKDLVSCGSEAKVKEKGLYRSEGKDYVVQNGDVLFFKFNV